MAPQSVQFARQRLLAAARRSSKALPAALPPVLVFTDPDRMPDPARVMAGLPRGWGVVYRHFGKSDRYEEARRLRQLSWRRGLVFMVGADAELAIAIGADGVHWPESKVRAKGWTARRWRGRFRLMTVSRHGAGGMGRFTGFDGMVVSAVFPSASPSAASAMGAVRFRRLARHTAPPLYGLGGVTARTAPGIIGVGGLAGIDGFSVFAQP